MAELLTVSVNLALTVLGLELLAVICHALWTRRVAVLQAAIFMIAAGLALILALKAVLAGAGSAVILLLLALGGVSHLIDLYHRLKDRDRS